MANQLRCITFDLDGTLVDAFAAVSNSLNHALSTLNYDLLDDDFVKSKVGWGETKLLSQFVKEEDLQTALSYYRTHHRESLKVGTVFLPHAQQILAQLKANGYILAIASNRPSPFTRIILEHLNIFDDFDFVLCADQVEKAKPSGDLLREILKKFDLTSDQMLYVGDMSIDVEAGMDAGVKTVCVLTGSHRHDDLIGLNPFAVIDSMDQLLPLLNGSIKKSLK